jgi:integrase
MSEQVFRRCTRSGCGRRLDPDTRRCVRCGGAGFTWAYVVDVGRGPDGRRRQRRGGGYARRKEAETAVRELLGRVDSGSYVPSSRTTVAEYLRQWLNGIRVKPTTLANYRGSAEAYVIPRLGGLPLQALTAEHLDVLYRELERSGRRDGGALAPKTVRHAHTMLRKALADAVKRGHLASNVADLANPPTQRQARSTAARDHVWTPEQLRAFLAAVRDHRLYAAWHVVATTGMRRAELLGLRWSDVDLDAAVLHAGRQTVTVAEGEPVWQADGKTDAAGREVALDTETVAVLRAHKRRQAEERLAAAATWTGDPRGPLLFTDRYGHGLDPEGFTALHLARVRDTGLPEVDVHGMRHSYATAALRAGVSPEVVSQRLGHADVSTTLSIYAHVRQHDDHEAAARAAAAILTASDVTTP